MYFVYLVECSDGTLYTGITTDVARRVQEHNSKHRGAKYTRTRQPVQLVYSEQFPNRSLAAKEEYRIKQLRREEKIKLDNIRTVYF